MSASRRLAALEGSPGVRLMHRTTRVVPPKLRAFVTALGAALGQGIVPDQPRLATATPAAATAMPTTCNAESCSPKNAKASTATTGGTR